jgi:alpha-galactosidase
VFIFYVIDTDGDGLPDDYELLYTSPPSPTAMNPGDDLEPDGLTNIQEYLIGTEPDNPDTDGDTLQDGDEVAGAGLRPPTDPLDADTDDDTLDDGVETNTGTYVSATDTGTDPTVADTDGDDAGDWYEITASYTDPTDSNDNPGIPYPLPDPDSTPPDTTKPVKVYILSGQSNMVGMGNINGTQPGTLETVTKRENKFPNLVDGAGNWTVRNDVIYRGLISAIGNGPLTVGIQGSTIGPETGFGHLMGYYYDEPVIIIKTSIGNRSLGWDFLPPGSEQFIYGDYTYAGYGDSPSRWLTGEPNVPIDWYAGKQYDDCVASVHAVLDDFDTEYPQYAAQGYEIAGFVWWQGHKDQGEPYASRYEFNLVNFINALRAEFDAPNASFVLATIAFGGWDLAGAGLTVANGQLAVSGETGNYPEFAGNVKTMEARGYWRSVEQSPVSQGYHYNRNAETFMLVGDALGRGMMELEAAYSVDAGPDMITWSDEPVKLDATVQDGVTVSSYAWSADPCDGVKFDPNEFVEDPNVTITKPALTLTAVTIVNPGFEDPVLTDGGWEPDPPAWTDGYYDVTNPEVWVVGDSGAGVYNPAAGADYGGVAPEGDNVMAAESGAGYDRGMHQVLSATLQANTQYDLSALVGNPFLFNGSTTTADYRIELLAGGVVVASDTGPSPADDTTWTTASLSYNSGASPAQLGQALEIRLLAVDFTDGKGVDFDDVKLTAESPTPDPYPVRLTLTVNDGENPPVANSLTIDVYDDACEATRVGKGLAADNPGDFDENCITDFEDLAVMAAKWLNDTGLTGPVLK